MTSAAYPAPARAMIVKKMRYAAAVHKVPSTTTDASAFQPGTWCGAWITPAGSTATAAKTDVPSATT